MSSEQSSYFELNTSAIISDANLTFMLSISLIKLHSRTNEMARMQLATSSTKFLVSDFTLT